MKEELLSATNSIDSTRPFETTESEISTPIVIVVPEKSMVPVTIEQLTTEVRQYLGKIGRNVIEVGKRLKPAKEMLPYGEWQTLLAENFNLSKMTANRFMRVAERFA